MNKAVIEIRPLPRKPCAGWAADSQAVAATGSDALAWSEFGNVGDADLQW